MTRMLLVYLARPPLYPGFVSGGERHFIEVCHRARTYGFELEVLTCPTGQRILELNNLKARTHLISVPWENFLDRTMAGLALIYLLRLIWFLPRLLSLPKGYQVICASSHYLADVLPAALISRFRGRGKMVVYLHHLEAPPRERMKYHPIVPSFLAWINLGLSLFFMRRYTHLVFVDPFVKEQLVKKGFLPDKIQIHSDAVDTARIELIPADGQFEGCFLGRIAPLKGIFDLVDIWRDICQTYPQAQIAVVGSNGKDYLSRLKEQILAHNLERNVLLLGSVSEERKYALLKAAKVFLSPSHEEGWGITVCEALACGLPVVAYDLPAYQAFGDEALFKVPLGDKRAFSQAVLRLLQDRGLREEMGEKAKRVARQYDWEEVARRELESMANLVRAHWGAFEEIRGPEGRPGRWQL